MTAMRVPPRPFVRTLKLREVSEINVRLEASKVRERDVAREYRISSEALQQYFELINADMRQLAKEMVRYGLQLMECGSGCLSQTTRTSTPLMKRRWLGTKGYCR